MKEGINEITIHETTTPEPKDGGSDFQIEKTPELNSLSHELAGVKNAIDRNEKITAEEILKIKTKLGDLVVSVGEEKVSIKELKNSENVIIWKEIKDGIFKNVNKATFLTPEIAEIISERLANIYLDHVRAISPEVAKKLVNSRRGFTLSLSGLTELSELVARELAKHRGALYLDGLTNMSKEVATILAEHRNGIVFLDGMHEISDEILECFSGRNTSLSFGGLTTISEKMAAFMVNRGGVFLDFPHLDSISEPVAVILAQQDGTLSLNSLSKISDGVAKALAQHKGVLNLEGLTTLSDTAVRYLSKHEDAVYLGGYIDISDKAAQYLAKHDRLGLRGELREKIDKYRNKHD